MTDPLLDGPTSVDLVLTELKLSGEAKAAEVGPFVAATNMFVRRWLTEPEAGWPADHVLGATLLAMRLYRRRDAPGGTMSFGEEGAVYVQGNWPDVAMLLQMGNYTAPRVG
jgi:hypothetical protein